MTRPVLRYHGGKWRIAPWIMSYFPPHRVYVEPYGGAGSVLMRKPRSEAEIYNDLDDDVVNVFRVLRDPEMAGRLEELLYLTPYSRTEFWTSYEPTEDPVERARRTIVRTTMSHGTTGRRAHRTGFRARCWAQRRNEAAGWVDVPDLIQGFVDRLRGVTIECRPALEVINQQDSPGTLFYVDPPYVLSTRSSIRSESEADGWRGYQHNMDDDEHRELLGVLRNVQGMVVLSAYDNEIYKELLGDWHRESKLVMADGGRRRQEVLWISPNVPAQQHELQYEEKK